MDVLVNQYGSVRNACIHEVYENNREHIFNIILNFLREEVNKNDPYSEFSLLLAKAMEIIANNEMEKVLKE